MANERIELSGVDYPDAKEKTRKRKPFFVVLPIRPRHMLWLLGTVGVAGWVMAYGTVHLRFQYVYSDLGPAHGVDRYFYRRCDYVGLHPQTIIPAGGKCPLFKWLKEPAESRS